jgi:ABC-type glycerol-3-phosphate transport system permease component
MAAFARSDRAMASAAGTRWSRHRLSRWAWRMARYTVLITVLVIFLMPLVWIWSSALKSSLEIDMNPFGLPSVLHWENLVQAWTVGGFGRYIGNSVLYCATIVTGVVVVSCLAGYALATLPIAGRNVIFIVFLLGLMVPFQSIMIPIYYLLRDLHILETYFAFIIPGIALGLPFGIFLMRAFFRGLPAEIADAARIDGANEWTVFSRVMLPLARPGLTTLIVFQFMYTWKAFLMPLVFVQLDELRPVALGMMFFFGRFTADRGMIAAGVTIAMLPIILLYLALQRQFISGITAGAVKS